MAERIDIEIIDKIAPTVSRKLKEIADTATRGFGALQRLNQQLQGLDSRALNALTRNQNAATNSAARLLNAQARMQQVNNQTAISAAKLATQNQKLAQASIQTANAQQRLAVNTANAQNAMTRAQISAQRYQRQLQNLNQQQQRMGRGGLAGGLLGGLSSAAGLSYVARAIDTYQRLSNQIAGVTLDSKEQAGVMARLQQIAAQTYTSVEGLTSVYQRFEGAARRNNVTGEAFYGMLTRISKAVALSGATGQEATGALRQLSQAFGANRLSGQELNSVLEQLPKVADAIAAQIGIGREQLRYFANQGLVTSDTLIKAFSETGKGIEELNLRFKRLQPTIGQAAIIAQDAFMIVAGQIAEVTGVSNGLADALILVASNMKYLMGPAAALFSFLILNTLRSTAAMAVYNTVISRNPLIIGISVFAGAIAGLAAITSGSETLTKVWEVLGNTVTSIILFVAKGLTGWADLIGLNTEGMHKWIDETETAMNSGTNLIDAASKRLGELRDRTSGLSAEANEFDQRWEELWRNGKKGIESNIDSLDRLMLSMRQFDRLYNKQGGAKIIRVRTDGVGQSDINRIPGTHTGGGYALGGTVTGPPGRDVVPAMLTAGEFVMNKNATSKYRGTLEAMNNSSIKGYAEGGLATGNYLPSGVEARESHSLRIGGADWEGLTESGFIPSFKPGGQIWRFTGQFGPKTLEAMAQQAAQIKAWKQDLTSWWQSERPNIYPIENRQPIDPIVNAWKQGLSKYVVDPREFIEANTIAGNQKNPAYDKLVYKFENVAKMLGRAGWAAPILSRAGIWGDTLGKYVNYTGPDYGMNVGYGGELKGGGLFASINPAAQAFINSLTDLPRFARGGSFTVGGSGGPDSQLVQFLASPNEQVSVRTPEQQQAGGMHINITMNISGADVQQWRRSENQVVGELSRKVRDYLQTNGLQ